MNPKKYDSFSPKRATNIDGFFAKPVNDRPRQPVFRGSAAKPQPASAKLTDMPKRSTPQAVLASSADAPAIPGEIPGRVGERRRRQAVPEAEGRARHKHRGPTEHGKHPWKKIFKRTGAILGSLLLVAALWFGFRFYRDIAKLTGNKNPLSLLSVFKPVALKNQDGRVNILVAANSADDAGHNGANLTDSIMVLSINTRNNTALILSVPRDLWVNIPGYGHAKINSAYTDGGMNKLQSVIQSDLGLPIHYQALVNYGAFQDLVNAVGGISITIKSDDPRGIYDPNIDFTTRKCCALAKYPNGKVTLNGHQALDLARARGDPGPYGYSYGFAEGDFTRTMHQRQMLVAIKDKASQSSVIANPFKVSSLVDAVGKNVKTNLQLDEIETLYSYMKKVDDNKIDSYNINTLKGGNTTMLANYTSSDGQSALIPAAGIDDYTDIQTQINKLFTADPVTKEGASVIILNGTDSVGLAVAQENKLLAKGMTVGAGNAQANQPSTTIIDNSGGNKPNTLAYLDKTYKATVVSNPALIAQYPSADFILILGQSAVPVPKTSTP